MNNNWVKFKILKSVCVYILYCTCTEGRQRSHHNRVYILDVRAPGGVSNLTWQNIFGGVAWEHRRWVGRTESRLAIFRLVLLNRV